MSGHKHWNLDFSIGLNGTNHSGNNIGFNRYPNSSHIGYNPYPHPDHVGHNGYPHSSSHIGSTIYPIQQQKHHYVYGHGERPPQWLYHYFKELLHKKDEENYLSSSLFSNFNYNNLLLQNKKLLIFWFYMRYK